MTSDANVDPDVVRERALTHLLKERYLLTSNSELALAELLAEDLQLTFEECQAAVRQLRTEGHLFYNDDLDLEIRRIVPDDWETTEDEHPPRSARGDSTRSSHAHASMADVEPPPDSMSSAR